MGLARGAARQKQRAAYREQALPHLSALGMDAGTLTVTDAGGGSAMDSAARRVAIFDFTRPEKAPVVVEASGIVGAQLDEAFVTRFRRNTTSASDNFGASGTTTVNSMVDRLYLDIRTPDPVTPLLRVPFLATGSRPSQGSKRHRVALNDAKLWQARLEEMARRDARR